MKPDTWMQTAGIICGGMLKLLWYLFLISAGVLIFLVMLCLEASKPTKNNGC